jgi:hypothetical protein
VSKFRLLNRRRFNPLFEAVRRPGGRLPETLPNPGAGGADVTLEEELKRLDIDIKKLKIQFDLYFVGANPRPPTDQRDALEKTIKKYQNVPMKNVADHFLYNAIVNRFNAFSELWNKSLRAREEGARVHPLALRAAQHEAAAGTGGSAGPAKPPPGGRAPGPRARRDADDPVWRISAVARDESALRTFYQNFIAAKERAGDARQPTFDAFAREIARHTAALRGKSDCEAIDFKIHSTDNKVSIKAKPSR